MRTCRECPPAFRSGIILLPGWNFLTRRGASDPRGERHLEGPGGTRQPDGGYLYALSMVSAGQSATVVPLIAGSSQGFDPAAVGAAMSWVAAQTEANPAIQWVVALPDRRSSFSPARNSRDWPSSRPPVCRSLWPWRMNHSIVPICPMGLAVSRTATSWLPRPRTRRETFSRTATTERRRLPLPLRSITAGWERPAQPKWPRPGSRWRPAIIRWRRGGQTIRLRSLPRQLCSCGRNPHFRERSGLTAHGWLPETAQSVPMNPESNPPPSGASHAALQIITLPKLKKKKLRQTTFLVSRRSEIRRLVVPLHARRSPAGPEPAAKPREVAMQRLSNLLPGCN